MIETQNAREDQQGQKLMYVAEWERPKRPGTGSGRRITSTITVTQTKGEPDHLPLDRSGAHDAGRMAKRA
jgi:hypothetical protein